MVADYTSATSVRALLGVSAKELPDGTVLDTFFWLSLQADLTRVCATLMADYQDAVEVVETDPKASTFAGSVGLFATYSVARSCMTALPQFAARSVTDGKAGFIRHTSTSFDNSMILLNTEYGRARASLMVAYAEYLPNADLPVSTTRGFMQVSSPSVDPVKGV